MSAQARRERDRRRNQANPYRAWYKTALWQKLRRAQLQREPRCELACKATGRVTAATVVDHKEPHRGDWQKFSDPNNLQSACKTCHDSTKAQQERRGYSSDVNEDGWPTDPAHPFNR